MRFEMTNDELAQAIEKAHQLTRTTAPQSQIFNATHDHFKALLEVQRSRSGIIVIDRADMETIRL